jgi:hypothetical protein
MSEEEEEERIRKEEEEEEENEPYVPQSWTHPATNHSLNKR